MEFSKIRNDGKHVELEYQESKGDGAVADITMHGQDPTPAFRHALQAFTSFVVWVHPWAPEVSERIEIRGVTIKRPDDAPRGIVVTALLKCPHARNSTSTVNTPYLAQAPDGYAGDFHGFLTNEVAGFIDELEGEATLYLNGERGEQTALALGVPETAPAPEKKKKRGKDFVPGVGDIVNPGATEPVTDDGLRQLLLSVDRDVPIDAIARWTSHERDTAAAWGAAQQKRMLGQMKEADMPKEPKCVKKDATLPLNAEQHHEHWGDEPPVHVSEQQAVSLRDKAARGVEKARAD